MPRRKKHQCSECEILHSLRSGGVWQDADNAIESANNGCPDCALLRDIIPLIPSQDNGSIWCPDYLENVDYGPNSKGVIMLHSTTGSVELTLQEGRKNRWNIALMSISSTDSQESLVQALEWLQTCIKSHSNCKPSAAEPVFPTRVLDIGTSGSTMVKLWEPKGQHGRYSCLSYCWGPSSFIKTTLANFETHKQGITTSALPRTFRDAIQVMKFFQIQYIWIDSLCIIQDSPSDWETEASKMASIYANAYVTFAATSSANVDEGLFRTILYEKVGDFCARPVEHFPDVPKSEYLKAFPLIGRSWCFQERLISPRVLHFGRDELVWECNSSRICQCEKNLPRRNEVTRKEYFEALRGSSATRLALLWRRLVMNYSSLALTFPSDKFPALSALASSMQQARGADYLSGLWRDRFLSDMMWYRADGAKTDNRMDRAPSWSWASIDGQVDYVVELYSDSQAESWGDCETYAKVIDVECTFDERATASKYQSGAATLLCCKCQLPREMAKVLITSSMDAKIITEMLGVGVEIEFLMDCRHILDGDYYLLQITNLPDGGMLVVRLVDESTKVYQRVGYARGSY